MFTKKFAWLRLVVAATYVLSACSVQPEAKTVVQTVEVEKIVEVEKTVEKVVTSEPAAAAVMQDGDKWCSGMKIRFFVGGDAGTPFAIIVNEGAIFATKDLGPSVDYVYSGWNNEKMLDQFRDAIAAKVDGIAFMGHAGDDAVMPLAQQACRSWDLDDVPERRCTQGSRKIWWGICRGQLGPARSGVGCRSYPDLGSEKESDHVLVIGPWAQPGRNIRELAVADKFEAEGFTVVRGDDSTGVILTAAAHYHRCASQ